MRLDEPQKYFIEVDGHKYRVYDTIASDKNTKFSGASSKPDTPKLYTVSDSVDLLYVGVTSRRMSSRLLDGLSADGEHGYHGYKWRTNNRRLALAIWADTRQPRSEDSQVFLETVEAEVAFLCRQAGQWPTFQHEIHFHPSSDIHRSEAQRIFDNVVGMRRLFVG